MSTSRDSELNLSSASGTIYRKMPARSDHDLQSISRRLELIRRALGISQAAMASRVSPSVTPQKWNNYERGRDRIPVETAIRVCVISGANLDYIYRGLMGGLPASLISQIEAEERVNGLGGAGRREKRFQKGQGQK